MKIGITFSPFDHLHAGYVKMLEEAKKQCDWVFRSDRATHFGQMVPL